MKYVYYDATTGMIKIISPVKEANPTDPFIEVEDHEVDDILNNRVNLLEYKVESESKTSTVGRVKKQDRVERVWTSINDWLYLIPNTQRLTPEFKIDQYITDKVIKITLAPEVAEWWKEHNYFQKESVLISACNGIDPHKIIWWKYIKSDDLISGCTLSYTGIDNLRFYTHRYFEEYLHEQHT